MRPCAVKGRGCLMSGVAARASVAATTPQVAARSTGCSGSVNALGPQAENKRAAPAAVTEILMSLSSFRQFRPANEQWTPLFRRTQMWIGLSVTAIDASLSAAEWVGWAGHV